MKATLVATLCAATTLIVAAAVQIWWTGIVLDHELSAKIQANVDHAPYASVVTASGYVNMLPAFLLALAAFLGVFVRRLRSSRAPSPEPRAPR